jgi:hypothetical protein
MQQAASLLLVCMNIYKLKANKFSSKQKLTKPEPILVSCFENDANRAAVFDFE